MTNRQYEKLKQAIQNRFDLGVSELDAVRVAELEALETVYRMTVALKTHDNSYGSVTKNAMRVIASEEVPDIFTKNDIIRAFGCFVSYNSLDGCLRRLVVRNFIEIVKKGKGRAPSKYRLSKTAKAFADAHAGDVESFDTVEDLAESL